MTAVMFRIFFASFLYYGKKWKCVVHLYLCYWYLGWSLLQRGHDRAGLHQRISKQKQFPSCSVICCSETKVNCLTELFKDSCCSWSTSGNSLHSRALWFLHELPDSINQSFWSYVNDCHKYDSIWWSLTDLQGQRLWYVPVPFPEQSKEMRRAHQWSVKPCVSWTAFSNEQTHILLQTICSQSPHQGWTVLQTMGLGILHSALQEIRQSFR